MAQTTMTENPDLGFPGQPADLGSSPDLSGIVEEANGISPGLGVVWGTAGRQVSLPSAAFTAADFAGFSVRKQKARQDLAVDNAEDYQDEESMPLLRKGRMIVTVEDVFVVGDPVFVRHTAPGTETIGAVRTDNDAGNASQVDGARFVSAGGAGELGVIEVNFP